VERLSTEHTSFETSVAVIIGELATSASSLGTRMTPFPAKANEVVALTVAEFTCELDLNATRSFERVGQRFLEDANRALVWFIRFRALTAWCEKADMAWLEADPSHLQRACELAASFGLNDDWQFDAEPFRSAVESVARH